MYNVDSIVKDREKLEKIGRREISYVFVVINSIEIVKFEWG